MPKIIPIIGKDDLMTQLMVLKAAMLPDSDKPETLDAMRRKFVSNLTHPFWRISDGDITAK